MPTERWLNVFDDTEMREFVAELRAAIRDVQSGKMEPELIDALQHEWRESAIRPADYLRDLKRTAPIRRA